MSRAFSLLVVVLVATSSVASLGLVGTASAAGGSQGMVGVPDSNVVMDVPANSQVPTAAAWRGSTMASSHADSLQVIVTTSSRASHYVSGSNAVLSGGSSRFAVVLSDTQAHDGRRVALPASVLKRTLGYVPKVAHGVHDGGTTWTSPVETSGSLVSFRVPHFSSNAVTFSSTVNVSGTFGDGSTASYDLSNLDAASAPNVTLTGTTSSERDTESGTVAMNGSLPVSIAGTVAPTNGSVSVTAPAANQSIYSGPSSQQAPVWGLNTSGFVVDSEVYLGNMTGNVSSVSVYRSSAGSAGDVDVYLVNEMPDGSFGDGTQIAQGRHVASSTGWANFSVPDVWVDGPVTVQFRSQSGTWGGNYGTTFVRTESGVSGGLTADTDGSTTTYDRVARASTSVGGLSSVSATSDGSTVSLGSIPAGETRTASIPVSLSTSSVGVSGSGMDAPVSASYTEHTQTADPSVALNGAWRNVSGTLADGATASRSWTASDLQTGTNTLEVAMPALSADAPAPKVALDYSHTASSRQTVDYTAEKWSERYNVSKTFASSRSSASLTVPFAQTVTSIRSLEQRVNGGSWQTVAPSDYSLNGTTLTAHLGSVATNDTVRVRTAASRVKPVNGEIEVVQPTVLGSRLASRISVVSTSGTLELRHGAAPDGDRLTYPYNTSWTTSDSFDRVGADGTRALVLPQAQAGSSFTVSTLPVIATPSRGEVALYDYGGSSLTEPTFSVSSGDDTRTDVSYAFVNARDGQDYELYSQTNGVVRDAATASGSSVTLAGDDSGETLQILEADAGGGSSSGSGSSLADGSGIAVGPISSSTSPLNSVPAVLLVGGAVVLGVALVTRRFTSSRALTLALSGAAAVIVLVLGTTAMNPTVLEPFAQAAAKVVPVLLIVGALALIYFVYLRWIKGSGPRPIQIVRGGGGK